MVPSFLWSVLTLSIGAVAGPVADEIRCLADGGTCTCTLPPAPISFICPDFCGPGRDMAYFYSLVLVPPFSPVVTNTFQIDGCVDIDKVNDELGEDWPFYDYSPTPGVEGTWSCSDFCTDGEDDDRMNATATVWKETFAIDNATYTPAPTPEDSLESTTELSGRTEPEEHNKEPSVEAEDMGEIDEDAGRFAASGGTTRSGALSAIILCFAFCS